MARRISQATNREKLFFMIMMFMWVASVSDLTSFNFGRNPILAPIYLVILIWCFLKFCHRNIKPLLLFLSFYFIWFCSSCIKYGLLQSMEYQPIYSIIIAHVAFNIYDKNDFLKYFEKVLIFLSSISLFVWLASNIIGEPFNQFMHIIAVVENRPPTDANCIITGIGSSFELGLRRNIGFTWEPGRYSCWILIGMFFNLIRNNFNFKNKNFIILLITLFTTLSTTGYSIIIILIFFYLLNKKSAGSKFLVVLICIAVIPTILGLSFMGDKIYQNTDISAGLNTIAYHNQHDGMDVVCPQRFTGCYVSILNFINDIFLGYFKLEYSYTSSVLFRGSVIVSPSEGIVNILAKYGIFVGLIFYSFLFKSTKFLSRSFDYKGTYVFALFFLMISFSYDWWENCIMMYFYLSSFYHHFDSRYFEGIKSSKYYLK